MTRFAGLNSLKAMAAQVVVAGALSATALLVGAPDANAQQASGFTTVAMDNGGGPEDTRVYPNSGSGFEDTRVQVNGGPNSGLVQGSVGEVYGGPSASSAAPTTKRASGPNANNGQSGGATTNIGTVCRTTMDKRMVCTP